jgi:hypothetical protein
MYVKNLRCHLDDFEETETLHVPFERWIHFSDPGICTTDQIEYREYDVKLGVVRRLLVEVAELKK